MEIMFNWLGLESDLLKITNTCINVNEADTALCLRYPSYDHYLICYTVDNEGHCLLINYSQSPFKLNFHSSFVDSGRAHFGRRKSVTKPPLTLCK